MDTTCLCCLLTWSSPFLCWRFERHYTTGVLEYQRSGTVTPSCSATQTLSRKIEGSHLLFNRPHARNTLSVRVNQPLLNPRTVHTGSHNIYTTRRSLSLTHNNRLHQNSRNPNSSDKKATNHNIHLTNFQNVYNTIPLVPPLPPIPTRHPNVPTTTKALHQRPPKPILRIRPITLARHGLRLLGPARRLHVRRGWPLRAQLLLRPLQRHHRRRHAHSVTIRGQDTSR